MTRKRLATLIVVLTLMVSSLAFSAPTAAKSNASESTRICRQLDDFGVLNVFDTNRGKCVNFFK